jgi:hypothetical protein
MLVAEWWAYGELVEFEMGTTSIFAVKATSKVTIFSVKENSQVTIFFVMANDFATAPRLKY